MSLTNWVALFTIYMSCTCAKGNDLISLYKPEETNYSDVTQHQRVADKVVWYREWPVIAGETRCLAIYSTQIHREKKHFDMQYTVVFGTSMQVTCRCIHISMYMIWFLFVCIFTLIDTFVLFKQTPLYQFNPASSFHIIYTCIPCHILAPGVNGNIQTSSRSEESKHEQTAGYLEIPLICAYCFAILT